MNSDFTAQDGQGGRERELLRQKLLLGSLVLDRAPSALRGWLKTPPARPQPDRDPAHRAWQVYRANAHAGAARALATAFPTVRALMGEASFEAMARAYPRWATLATYDNPGAWVYRVGLNWARSHRRRLARRLPWAQPTEELPAPVADPAVRDALLALPIKLRSVVVCRLLLDWSVDDTATALGVRPGTVQSRLHRALRTLNSTLDHLR